MRLDVQIDNREALASLRGMRKDIGRDVRDALLQVANDIAVPRARSLAPAIVRSSVIARATTRDAYLTTSSRGRNRRIFGYLNFGGTVRSPIVPRRARALRMPDGNFVALVNTPRKFAGLHFFERSVEGQQERLREAVSDRVLDALQRHIRAAYGL